MALKRKSREPVRSARSKEACADASMLQRINSVRISREEMLEFVQECQRLPAGGRDFEGHALTAVRLHSGDVEKVTALVFRLRALAHLVIKGKGAPGWTLSPGPDGSVMTQDAVLAAAAVEPLAGRDGQLMFRRQGLLKRALRLADVDTKIQ